MRERKRFLVRGRVQGVYFRANTQRVAEEHHLVGYVRNLQDGSVEVVAEGDSEALKQLEAWLWVGPPAARVLEVTGEALPLDTPSFTDFSIRY